MQRNTGNTESITIEYGFLDSKKDDVNQLKENWKNYAEAVVRSIMKYLNLPYIPVNSDENYIVKRNDTLWSIAKKYGITVYDIKKENNLSSSNIKVGQILKMPGSSLNQKDNTYTVKKGDTIFMGNNEYE